MVAAMADIADFLGFLRDHEGRHVGVELGRRDIASESRDRPLAVLDGALGVWEMVDGATDAQQGVAWVPVGESAEPKTGFFVAAHRAISVVIDRVGATAWFDDDDYVAVVPRLR
jgi:hypothetical protein